MYHLYHNFQMRKTQVMDKEGSYEYAGVTLQPESWAQR
jgi:hypothetical protein